MIENCFLSPEVITVKKGKSVKVALDSRKLNDITVKWNTRMPNIEESITRISRKIADGPADENWFAKIDLDYASGQLNLSEQARDLCLFAVTGGIFTCYYVFIDSLKALTV